MNGPYDVYVIMVGDGVPAPLCGVLPMVALTPKGVRYPGLSAEYDKETKGDMLARQARYTLCVRYNRRMAIAICCKFCEFATREGDPSPTVVLTFKT